MTRRGRFLRRQLIPGAGRGEEQNAVRDDDQGRATLSGKVLLESNSPYAS